MAEKQKPKQYKLKEVCIRLAEGHPLYSDQPLSTPAAALDVMRREMSQYDREVLCVVNMNARLQPINFNVVSVGDINASIAAIPNILKSGLMSNASSFMLLHNHPSGDVTPSQDDITTTRKVIEAGKIMGIPCVDHIVIGGGNGQFCSLREQQLADFNNQIISMTAEDILRVADSKPTYEGETKEMPENARDSQVPDFVQEAEAQMAKEAQAPKREEVTIKFGKGLAEPIQSKDGRKFMRIMIPNQDQSDKTPWASFVLPAKAVHENQYGKGLWAKIPAEGHTTVTKPERTEGVDGEIVWENRKESVPNAELKEMVEAYKTRNPKAREAGSRESAREKLDSLTKETAAKLSPEGRKAKPRDCGPEH